MSFKHKAALVVSALFLFIGCGTSEPEKEEDKFDLTTSSVSVPADGGTVTISFITNSAWWASNDATWMTLSKQRGSSSDTSLDVTVARNTKEARESTITFQAGSVERKVTVSQESGLSADGIQTLGISEFKALNGDGNWYRLTGEIVSISSYTYGDLYVSDGSGFLYIYGLATEKGGDNKEFSKLGLKAGDVITFVAKYKNYNGLIETEGAYFESKASGTYPGFSSKDIAPKWLELPAAASSNDDMVFVSHRDETGKRNFSAYLNKTERLSRWVCYPYVFGEGEGGRNNDPYAFDPLVDPADQASLTKSYQANTFDGEKFVRGHMVPSNDRKGRANYDVFLASNIMPQSQNLNGEYQDAEGKTVGGIWGNLEVKKIHKNWAGKCDTLYVVTGTYTKDSKYKVKDVDGKEIVVPVAVYKAVLAHTRTGEYKALGAYFENKSNPLTEFKKESAISIDELEKKVGEDFFVNLPSVVGESEASAIEAADPASESFWWD